jgi:hypothetical protein
VSEKFECEKNCFARTLELIILHSLKSGPFFVKNETQTKRKSMSTIAASTSSTNALTQSSNIFKYIKPIGIATGLGAVLGGCVGGILGVVDPVGGVIFGATAAAADAIAATILLSWSGDNSARYNLGGFLLIPLFFVNVAAASALTTMVGFPITWIGVAVCAGAVLASHMLPKSLTTLV